MVGMSMSNTQLTTFDNVIDTKMVWYTIRLFENYTTNYLQIKYHQQKLKVLSNLY